MARPHAPDNPNANPDPIDERLYCPKCAYNLTGVIESRCPECGRPFNRLALRKFGKCNIPPISDFGCFAHVIATPFLVAIFPMIVLSQTGPAPPGFIFIAVTAGLACLVLYWRSKRLAERLYARRLRLWRLRYNPNDRTRYVRSRMFGILASWFLLAPFAMIASAYCAMSVFVH